MNDDPLRQRPINRYISGGFTLCTGSTIEPRHRTTCRGATTSAPPIRLMRWMQIDGIATWCGCAGPWWSNLLNGPRIDVRLTRRDRRAKPIFRHAFRRNRRRLVQKQKTPAEIRRGPMLRDSIRLSSGVQFFERRLTSQLPSTAAIALRGHRRRGARREAQSRYWRIPRRYQAAFSSP